MQSLDRRQAPGCGQAPGCDPRRRKLYAPDAPPLPLNLAAEVTARERWLAAPLPACLAAAEAGDAAAQCAMGWRHFPTYPPRGVQQSFDLAAPWFRLSADAGFAHAQRVLAGLTINGKGGLAPDASAAAKLYTLAANQGIADAAFALGRLHETGEGVARDLVAAERLYRAAAAAGLLHARKALARLGLS